MKIKNKILILIITTVSIILFWNTKIYAASATLTSNKTSATVGDTITATVTIVAASWDVDFSVVGVESKQILDAPLTATSNITTTSTITFTATEAKTYNINVSGDITDYSETEATYVTKSLQIVVSEKVDTNTDNDSNTGDTGNSGNTGSSGTTTTPSTTTKSSDANIYSMKMDAQYSPSFSKNTTDYYVTVDSDVNKLTGLSYNEADGASYKTSGNSNFVSGTNRVQLIITAEDGVTTKTYNIWVTKKVADNEEEDTTGNIPDDDEDVEDNTSNEENSDDEENQDSGFGLEKLIITGLEINPEFQTNVYEYSIDVNTDIETLDILATANEEDAIIEIFGADNLVEGENIITIIVTSEDGTEVKTYQIIVNKISSIDEEEIIEENNNLIYYIIAAIILIVTVTIVIGCVIKKNRSRTIFEKEEDNNKGKRFK